MKEKASDNKKEDRKEKLRILDLPHIGMSRFSQFESLLPFSKEKFRQLSKAGLAPTPMRMGVRCTFYSNSELLKFLADPINYKVGE